MPTKAQSAVTAAAIEVGGVPSRLHNVLSYSATVVVFWTAAGILNVVQGGGGDHDYDNDNGLHRAPTVIAAAMWTAHFIRRTIESAFVHRYSVGKIVSWVDALCEYAYYWGFAAWIALTTTDKNYSLPVPTMRVVIGSAVFIVGEIGNAMAHQSLRGLRPNGSSTRKIPSGRLFRWISCPHYSFEIVSWIGAAIACGTWANWVFVFAGSLILAFYSQCRHRAYKEEFDGREGQFLYPTHRRRLVPFIF